MKWLVGICVLLVGGFVVAGCDTGNNPGTGDNPGGDGNSFVGTGSSTQGYRNYIIKPVAKAGCFCTGSCSFSG
jgi:hypothetical protein